jgi:hypothetical protein
MDRLHFNASSVEGFNALRIVPSARPSIPRSAPLLTPIIVSIAL